MSILFDDYGEELNHISTQISKFQNASRNKLCIYTCLFGDFDDFNQIPLAFEGFDSIIITNQKHIQLRETKCIYIDWLYRSERRTNRLFKILPHLFFSSYDISLYYDCNLVFKLSPLNLVRLLDPIYDFGIFNHNKRDCLFDEIDECIFWNKDSTSLLKSQKEEYKSVPKNNGLYLGSVLIRRHLNIKDFSEFWWSQYEEFSARDQISLAYAFFITKVKPQIFDISGFNDFFKKRAHNVVRVNESKLNIYQVIRFEMLIFLVRVRKMFLLIRSIIRLNK